MGLKSEMASSISVENESKEPSRENSSDEGKTTHEFMLSGGGMALVCSYQNSRLVYPADTEDASEPEMVKMETEDNGRSG